MYFKKWAAPLLGIGLSVLAGHALAGTTFNAVDGERLETVVFEGTLASAPGVTLVPMRLKASRHHSIPDRLTTFTIMNASSPYLSLVPVSSDPFTTNGPRRYVDTLTLKEPANVVITLRGTVDSAANTNEGVWTATDMSQGRFRVTTP